MTTDMRLEALKLAANCAGSSDPQTLLDTADMIERHLRGGDAPAAVIESEPVEQPTEIDFAARMTEPKPVVGANLEWSGIAQDLVRLFNTGNTLVRKARQIGMTTLLAEYTAHQTREGKSVLYLAPHGSNCAHFKELVQKRLANLTEETQEASRADFDTLALKDILKLEKGRRYDIVIIDEMASLPFALEAEFLARLLPCGDRFIFSSAASQGIGLFHDLWRNSQSFQKAMLTAYTPLSRARDVLASMTATREMMGEDSFKNQFEGQFRVVTAI